MPEDNRKTSSMASFLRGIVGGVALGSAVAICIFRPQSGYLELAFNAPDKLEESLGVAAATRVNTATERFMEALILVERQHVEAELDGATVDTMLDAALSQLDPFSGFYDRQAAAAMTSIGDETHTPRLGVMVMDFGNAYTIEAVLPDGPAESAGLRPGDRVVRVGSERVDTLDPRKVNERISGEIAAAEGGKVSLGVRRPGEAEEISVSVLPAPVKAVGAYDLGREGNVLHIHLERFYEGAAEDVAGLVRRAMARGPLDGLVLDLRDNGGGLTSEVRILADLFLQKGALIYEMYGRRVGVESVRAETDPEFADLGLSVIVNGNSASASEIFAAAVQAHRRGRIFGWKTYGKGTVQRVYPTEGGAVKITVAHYRDGGLRAINGVGVSPDVSANYPDPGHRPSRFSSDPVRDMARDAARRKPYVAAQ